MQRDARAHALSLRNCFDGVYVALIAGLAALLCGAGIFVILLLQAWGTFDPPEFATVPDHRILQNFREELPDRALLDVVRHDPTDELVVLQEGGRLNRLDLRSRLWRESRIPSQLPGVSGDVVTLRSGCGQDQAVPQETCLDREAIWALADTGALLRNGDGENWSVVLGDTSFIGLDGKPVQSTDLVSAAVGANRSWLLLATRNNGLGLYHIATQSWMNFPASVQQQELPSTEVRVVRWWRDRFWIATAAGLAELEVSAKGRRLEARTDFEGEVLDLEVAADPDDGLFVLEQRRCVNAIAGCLRLTRLRSSGDGGLRLLEESNLYPGLSLGDLNFADLQAGDVVAAGRAGVFAYDPDLHAWRQLDDRPVLSTFKPTGGGGFYYGYAGGVAELRNARPPVKRWSVSDARFRKIFEGPDKSLRGLSEDGRLYGLAADQSTYEVFVPSRSHAQLAQLRNAWTAGNLALFTRQGAAVIHDVTTRDFRDLNASQLESWLLNPGRSVVQSGSRLFGLSESGQGTGATAYDLESLAAGKLTPDGFTPRVRGRVVQARPWTDKRLAVVGSDGAAYALGIDNDASYLVGPPGQLSARTSVNDVLVRDGGILLATNDGILGYSTASRSWSQTLAPGTAIRELDQVNGRLLLVTGDGRLVDGQGLKPVIGSTQSLNLTDRDLSDALAQDDILYLAGAGRVTGYDLRRRQVLGTGWAPAAGPVRLLGVHGGLPVFLASRRIWQGGRPLTATGNPVVTASLDGQFAWAVQQDGDNRYLSRFALRDNGGQTEQFCFFKRPKLAGASRFLDVRPLGDGKLAVLTDGGLAFYDQGTRRWYQGADFIVRDGARLRRTPMSLLVTYPESGATHLLIVPLNSLRWPHSCSDSPVSFDRRSFLVRSISVDENRGRAAWLDNAGRLYDWHDQGEPRLVLARDEAPASAGFRRVFQLDDSLVFLADGELWRYRMSDHAWQKIKASDGSHAFDRIHDVTIESAAGEDVATIVGPGGGRYVADLKGWPEAAATEALPSSIIEPLGADARQLVDVVQPTPSEWTFVLKDRLRTLDVEGRSWERDIVFPAGDSVERLGRFSGRSVVVTGGGNSWWLAKQRPRPAGEAEISAGEVYDRVPAVADDVERALGSDWRIHRLRPDGSVLSCRPEDDARDCEITVPAAMLLRKQNVVAAYEWLDWILFVTRDRGLRQYDPRTRREAALAGGAAITRVPQILRRHGSDLWLVMADGQVFRLSSDRSVTHVADDVDELFIDRWNAVWLQADSRLGRIDRGVMLGDAESFGLPKDTPIYGATLRDDGTAAAAAADGRLVAWLDGELTTSAPLPFAENDRSDISVVFSRSRPGSWWVQIDDRFLRFDQMSCPAASTAPGEEPDQRAEQAGGGAVQQQVDDAPDTPVDARSDQPDAETCMVETRALEIPGADILRFFSDRRVVQVRESGPSEIAIRLANGESYRLTETTDKEVKVAEEEWVFAGARPGIPDRWDALEAWVAQRPDGQSAYDPVTGIRVSADRRLEAVTPSRPIFLAAEGTQNPESEPPLDAGWIQWRREARRFDIATVDGRLELEPERVIVNGGLIFGAPGIPVALGRQAVVVGNAYGIWQFPDRRLSLRSPSVMFRPMNWLPPVAAAHGRFLFRDGAAYFDGRQAPSNAETIAFGDVLIRETLHSQEVVGTATVSGSREQLFGVRGFLWDNRHDVAVAAGDLFLRSDQGIHPVEGFTGFDAGPSGRRASSAQLAGDGREQLLLRDGRDWHQRVNGTWRGIGGNPFRIDEPVRNVYWSWRRDGDRISVEPRSGSQSFAVDVDGRGIGFTADRLIDAAALSGTLYIMTAADFEVAESPRHLGDGSSKLYRPGVVDDLEVMALAPGQSGVYGRRGNHHFAWNDTSKAFESLPANANPFQQRMLVDTQRLRFEWTESGGAVRVQPYLRVDRFPQGTMSWVPFGIERTMPFDQINSIAVLDGTLYLGSRLGLQVYDSAAATSLDDVTLFVDMRRTASGPLSAVDRLGEPHSDRGKLAARASGFCLVRGAGTPFARCNGSLLDAVQLGQNRVWTWMRQRDGTTTGQYLTDRGSILNGDVRIRDGHFPHDHLDDLLACGSRRATLWTLGGRSIVTTYDAPGLGIGLTTSITTRGTGKVAQRLICLDRDFQTQSFGLTRGLYLEFGDGAVWRIAGADWSVLTADAAEALLRRANGEILMDRGALRLVRAPNKTSHWQYQALTDAGRWLDVPWDQGRTALEAFDEAVVSQGTTWIATALGLVALDGPGKLTLDPDRTFLARAPDAGSGPCQVDVMLPHEDETAIRCASGGKPNYLGRLRRTGRLADFGAVSADLFAEVDYIGDANGAFWHWRRVGHVSREQPGELSVTLHGEPVSLNGGRFIFDDIRELAGFRKDHIEVAARGYGWFQVPTNSFHPRDIQRPASVSIAPREVVSLSVGGQPGQRELCVRLASGVARNLAEDGRELASVGHCEEWLGFDGLWSYLTDSSRLLVRARDRRGGAGLRQLKQGRFLDAIAIGYPAFRRDGADFETLIPTVGGVSVTTAAGSPKGIYFPGLPGLEPDAAPRALTSHPGGTPLYVGTNYVRELDSGEPVLGGVGVLFPEGAEALGLSQGPDDRLRIDWTADGDRGFTLVPLNFQRPVLCNALPVYVEDWWRFVGNRRNWDDPSGLIYVVLPNDGQGIAVQTSSAGYYETNAPDGLEYRKAVRAGTSLFLLERDELWEVDLPVVMMNAFEQKPAR